MGWQGSRGSVPLRSGTYEETGRGRFATGDGIAVERSRQQSGGELRISRLLQRAGRARVGWLGRSRGGSSPQLRRVPIERRGLPAPTFEERLAEETRRSFEAGRERGHEEGRRAEREAMAPTAAAEAERRRRQAAELVESFARERDRYLHAVEQEVVRLALAVAARILRREAQIGSASPHRRGARRAGAVGGHLGDPHPCSRQGSRSLDGNHRALAQFGGEAAGGRRRRHVAWRLRDREQGRNRRSGNSRASWARSSAASSTAPARRARP